MYFEKVGYSTHRNGHKIPLHIASPGCGHFYKRITNGNIQSFHVHTSESRKPSFQINACTEQNILQHSNPLPEIRYPVARNAFAEKFFFAATKPIRCKQHRNGRVYPHPPRIDADQHRQKGRDGYHLPSRYHRRHRFPAHRNTSVTACPGFVFLTSKSSEFGNFDNGNKGFRQKRKLRFYPVTYQLRIFDGNSYEWEIQDERIGSKNLHQTF